MFATTHVVIGALIGRAVRRPANAFGFGVASHLVMDALPHWGMKVSGPADRCRFLAIATADGLLLTAFLAVAIRRGRPVSEIAGALGGLLLDLDKPAAELGIEQLWPDRLHRAHVDIQVWESPRRWPVDAALTLAAAALLSATGNRPVATAR